MIRPNTTFFIAATCLCLILQGCKKDLETDNTDKNFPVKLGITQNGDAIDLNWDVALVSKFEGYTLVRASEPIPPGLTPTSNQGTFQVVFQSERPDSTHFTDNQVPLVSNLYYKLYVDIGDRFVESESIKVSYDNFLLDGNAFIVDFLPDSNWVIIGNDISATIQLVDYEQKKLISTSSQIPFTSFGYLSMETGRYQGNTEVYWWPGSGTVLAFDLPALTTIQSNNISNYGYSIATNNDGLLFFASNDYTNSFSTRRRSDFSLVKGVYEQNYYDRRILTMLDESTNRILETSSYQCRMFNVDGTTGALSNQINKSLDGFNMPVSIPISADHKYFIPQFDGKILDLYLNTVAIVPNSFNGFVDLSFSPDGQFIYALYSAFNFSNAVTIVKYKFPSIEQVGSKTFSNVSGRRIKAIPDGVIFVGSNVNNLNQMIIKKVNF